MSFWKEIKQEIGKVDSVIVLCVVESIGSSPGRQGFKMLVTRDSIYGSIGGGFMEHKLVELSKSKLKEGRFTPFIKRQVHQSNIPEDKSGMICSGEQTIAFVYVDKSDLGVVNAINEGKAVLSVSESGLAISESVLEGRYQYDAKEWGYLERLNFQNHVVIIGGGHVGLALSKTMYDLDFSVTIIDNRDYLNTMEGNQYASVKKVVDYNDISTHVPEGENVYLVLASFGFKTDKVCVQNLLGKNLKYFGVMGSQEKMRQLIDELKEEGYSKSEFDSLYTPIGVPIGSKTPAEIAISIAAEIIGVKNRV
jgi:xanthine dehydrogenase accessory factor